MSLLPYPRGRTPHEMMQLLSSAFGTARPGSVNCARHARLDLKAAVVPQPTLYDRKSLLPLRLPLSSFSAHVFANLHFQKCAYTKKLKLILVARESLHKLQRKYFRIICSFVHPNGFLNYAEYTCSEQVYPSL